MGVVNLTVIRAGASSLRGSLPVPSGTVLSTENITSSAVTAPSTTAATDRKDIFRIATDTAVYVVFGLTPVATAATGIYVHANTVYEHGGHNVGTKIAVIDV